MTVELQEFLTKNLRSYAPDVLAQSAVDLRLANSLAEARQAIADIAQQTATADAAAAQPAESVQSTAGMPGTKSQAEMPLASADFLDDLLGVETPAEKFKPLNPTDTLGYLKWLFEPNDWVDIKFIHQTKKYPGSNKSVTKDGFQYLGSVLEPQTPAQLEKEQAEGWNVYIAMNAFTPGLYRRRAIDVKNVRAIYVELDENGLAGVKVIKDLIRAGSIPEFDFILESSQEHFYIIWRVQNFSVAHAEALNKALQVRCGSDPQSVDGARILRLPGTRNLKPSRNGWVVRIIEENAHTRRYEPTDFKIEINVRQHEKLNVSSMELEKSLQYLTAALDEAKVDYNDPEPYGNGNDLKIDLVECPWADEHTQELGRDGASLFLPYGFKCLHSHCACKGWVDNYRPWLEETVGHPLQFGDPVSIPMVPHESKQPEIPVIAEPNGEPWSLYGLTQEQYDEEMDKEYPVLNFVTAQPGPAWDDSILYGIAGDIVKKASAYCEAHPAGMYLDLLVALGNVIGHQPYFRITPTAHYANEYVARVGVTSTARKGTGQNAINEILNQIDNAWFTTRVHSGFGSAEAIVNEIRDPFTQKVKVTPKNGQGPTFKEITVPGVDDKRLFIRIGELADVFKLANTENSKADVILRLGWDDSALDNIVKGRGNDGISNSCRCANPHISISADTTKDELLKQMPNGADQNGFANRFMYCYVYRTKLSPNGSPEIDWAPEIFKLTQAIQFARGLKQNPLTHQAHKLWNRMYESMERNRPAGQLGLILGRGPAHVRRIALILALLDMSDCVQSWHLHAAKRIWDYCEESAQYIFVGYTKDQLRILRFVEGKAGAKLTEISADLFHWNHKANWVKAQIDELVERGYLIEKDGVYQRASVN